MHRDLFVPPLPDDDVEFLRRATIVLDTNVLLSSYRLSEETREEVLTAFEFVTDRLWIPHQVGVEFYRHQPGNRDERSRAYDSAVKAVRGFEQLATKPLGKGRTHEDLRKNVASVVRDAVAKIESSIAEIRSQDSALTTATHDPVLERIEKLVGDNVGAQPDPSVRRALSEEFELWRAPNRIPPGFEDRGKEGLARQAGDYLIWAEVLVRAQSGETNVLFVTEDEKDDWWETVGGVRRPHRELVLEFQEVTGRSYHQVGLDDFVRLVSEAAGREANDAALDEIEAVAEESAVELALSRIAERLSRNVPPLPTSALENVARYVAETQNTDWTSPAMRDALHNISARLSSNAWNQNTSTLGRLLEEQWSQSHKSDDDSGEDSPGDSEDDPEQL